MAGQCRDPWITQAIHEVTGRWPNGDYESGECAYTQYGGGRWNSYAQLKGYVQQRLGSSYSINRNDFPAISYGQFNALPKRSVGGSTYALYNGHWMRLITDNGGAMRLITSDGASIVAVR
jgi:hypothetical protein